MQYYNRVDISEGTYLSKISRSKEFIIWHYWFFNHGFEFQDSAWNGCHDLTMLIVNIYDIVIITIEIVDYRCIIHSLKQLISVLEDRGYTGYIH